MFIINKKDGVKLGDDNDLLLAKVIRDKARTIGLPPHLMTEYISELQRKMKEKRLFLKRLF